MTENSYPLVSVYTCVYNGESTIHRVFESMKNLDYPNIEHIIVNDGSEDNTEALIQEYIKQVSFPVKYHKKENGGKHTALNVAWSLAEGEFMLQLDADDKLLSHGVKYLVDTYYQIPEDIREQYWCVHGRCITQDGDFVGDKYPKDINNGHWKETGQRARKCGGDKVGLQLRKYLCNYRFPEVKGVSHIAESIIWKQINEEYGTWYTNEVVVVYYVNEGGNLTAKKTKRRQFSSLAFKLKWQIMHEKEYGENFKTILTYPLIYYVADNDFRKYNAYLEGIKCHRVFLRVLQPIMFIAAFVYRALKKIK